MRRLLEDPQTWVLAGRGTVDDLALRIASCLFLGDGRTDEHARAAGMVIARGMLEFAAADLDPKLFQRLLFARLERMESGQASALDEGLLGLHADLAARLAVQEESSVRQFDDLMGHLRRVLNQLPGPAGRGEVAVYLKVLIDWLGTDPWPQDRRFAGPLLTPAVIERRLRVTVSSTKASREAEQDIDADALARQCRRLVVLGGPGSGKTWLAKRTARRHAEEALRLMAAGASLDEIELPLYSTCSYLLTTRGDIREAIVTSALAQLGDLGGSRISAALCTLFTERNGPTLLVIDSLDEARGSDERLRQADTLPWRIILTSRPSSWNRQLAIKEEDVLERVGELQPLRFPDDVEPLIRRWFTGRPELGDDLAAQISRRPELQKAVTVPLILALYCIVGGGRQLPEFRRDLYARVLNRMLTGRWRGSHSLDPDPDICLLTLRAWAWRGAASDPVSGIGTWDDDILVGYERLGKANEDALDHIASPLGPPDLDTGKTMRRFIHRSVREYLVAEHVASLPADEAAQILLPHLWFDLDWEYSLPATFAMHPQRDYLLREVLSRLSHPGQIPQDLSVLDVGWEFRELLARIACECSEADWSPEIAGLIGQVRVELARSGRFDCLGWAVPWATSNRQAREELLGSLTEEVDGWTAVPLANGLAKLAPTAEEVRLVRDILLGVLGRDIDSNTGGLIDGVIQFAPTARDKREVRAKLLGILAAGTDSIVTEQLVGGLTRLAPAAEDKLEIREALLRLLVGQGNGWTVAALADGIAKLVPTAQDRSHASEALLGLLSRPSGSVGVERLVHRLVQLNPTPQHQREARTTLLRSLESLITSVGSTAAEDLVRGLNQLSPTPQEQRQARGILLRSLDTSAESAGVPDLVRGLIQLDPTPQEQRQAREILLRSLDTSAEGAGALVRALIQLDPTPQEQRQTRETLQRSLAAGNTPSVTAELAECIAQLDPTVEYRRSLREVLLRLLANEKESYTAVRLVNLVLQLGPTADDESQARSALLGLLVGSGYLANWPLAGGIIPLTVAAEDKRLARKALLSALAASTENLPAKWSAHLARLGLANEDGRDFGDAMLGLANGLYCSQMASIADLIARLDPTSEEKSGARQALLSLLAIQTERSVAETLIGQIAQLSPTIHDFDAWRAWEFPLTAEMLDAVRQTTAFSDWLAALPMLTSVSAR